MLSNVTVGVSRKIKNENSSLPCRWWIKTVYHNVRLCLILSSNLIRRWSIKPHLLCLKFFVAASLQ